MENTVEIESVEHVGPQPDTLQSIWIFVRHLLEMCLAMCLGGIPLIVLFFFGAARVGYPDLFQQSPELSVLVIGFILALPMSAWMRLRGHGWRPTLEMAGTSILLAILLVSLGWLGILPEGSLFEWFTRFACPVMLIPMFLRLDMYTGRSAHCH